MDTFGVNAGELAYDSNINLKAIPLKNINTQFQNATLENGLYYYDWYLTNPMINNLNFEIKEMGIKLPF